MYTEIRVASCSVRLIFPKHEHANFDALSELDVLALEGIVDDARMRSASSNLLPIVPALEEQSYRKTSQSMRRCSPR